MRIVRVTLAIVAIATLAPRANAQQAPADSTSPALIAEGRKVFQGASGGAICFSCHAMNAKGMPGIGPDLTDGKWLHGDGGMQFLRDLIKAGVAKPKQSAAAMPPMGGAKLSEAQIQAVAAYVHSLNKKS